MKYEWNLATKKYSNLRLVMFNIKRIKIIILKHIKQQNELVENERKSYYKKT